jgi:hypothetical protein
MSRVHRLLGLGALVALAASGIAAAETMPGAHGTGSSGMEETMHEHHGQMLPGKMPAEGRHAAMHDATRAEPAMPGQAAFGAVQEIVRMLEADLDTDWSKVNLSALREHLIDMDEVTLRAAAAEKPVDGGLEVAVTGAGRTLQAIQRMVPAHAQELNGLHGWAASTSPLPSGILLTVTTTDPNEIDHIRGLGFIGLLASGSHHQLHHLAMARGERHAH